MACTATDAVKFLQVYFKIKTLQDSSMRMERNEFGNNWNIDVVALHGNIDTILSTSWISYLKDTKMNNSPMTTLEKCMIWKILLLQR